MKNLALNVAFRLLGRAFGAVYSIDNIMKSLTREALGGSETVITRIGVMGSAQSITMKSTKNGISTINARENRSKIDLNVVFKHRDTALKVLTGQISVVDAYTDKNFYAEGSVAAIMIFLEQCELVLSYLLPKKTAFELLGYLPERAARKSRVFKRLIFAKRL